MNADMFLHGFSILNDAKIILKNLRSKHNNSHYINYISSIVGNVEHTFETVYELLKTDKSRFFQRKENIILIIEIVKFLFKLNELKQLKREGFNFYVEKSIYFNDVLKKNEEEEIDELEKVDTTNIFHIKKKKSNKNYNINTNLIKMPEKIASKFIRNDVNSTDDSIRLGISSDLINASSNNNNNYHEFYNMLKEILYLIRPVIYMAALTKFKEYKIIPLIISLIIDYIYLDSKAHLRGSFSKQKIYYAEYLYRYRRLLIYIFREPIFSMVTIPVVKKVLSILRMPESVIRWAEIILNYFTKYYYIL